MNGRDALPGTSESPLSEFDIVSGDLIRVLQTTQNNQSTRQDKQSTNTKQATEQTASSAPKKTCQKSSLSSSESMSNCDKPSTSQQHEEVPSTSPHPDETQRMDCTENTLCRLNEPMLCRESTDTAIPLRLRQLLNEWQVFNPCETLCIALHVLMLETGFTAKLSQVS